MAKLRVYELAKELGVDSKRVMAALMECGEFVRSASSTVEPAVAQVVRTRLRQQPGGENTPGPERGPSHDPVPAATESAWPAPR